MLFEGALWMLNNEVMSLQESIERFILPRLRGKSGVARIGGGEDDVIGIHAGAWYFALPADWYLLSISS